MGTPESISSRSTCQGRNPSNNDNQSMVHHLRQLETTRHGSLDVNSGGRPTLFWWNRVGKEDDEQVDTWEEDEMDAEAAEDAPVAPETQETRLQESVSVTTHAHAAQIMVPCVCQRQQKEEPWKAKRGHLCFDYKTFGQESNDQTDAQDEFFETKMKKLEKLKSKKEALPSHPVRNPTHNVESKGRWRHSFTTSGRRWKFSVATHNSPTIQQQGK